MKTFLPFLVPAAMLTSARAELSAPDNILYGTISVNGAPLPSTNTSITVEARRTATGPAIASYRMGSNPEAEGFYTLSIPLEERDPLDLAATSSLVSDSVFVVISDGSSDLGQQTYLIPERGRVTRMDFSINSVVDPGDTDNDDLPDAWEQSVFLGLGQAGTGDFDNDGKSNLAEYLAGTNAKSPIGSFQLVIAKTGTTKTVSFFAVSSSGVAGYQGVTRRYAIESAANLSSGPWTPVSGFSNIIGGNTTVTYTTLEPDPKRFYRGKVWLTSP